MSADSNIPTPESVVRAAFADAGFAPRADGHLVAIVAAAITARDAAWATEAAALRVDWNALRSEYAKQRKTIDALRVERDEARGRAALCEMEQHKSRIRDGTADNERLRDERVAALAELATLKAKIESPADWVGRQLVDPAVRSEFLKEYTATMQDEINSAKATATTLRAALTACEAALRDARKLSALCKQGWYGGDDTWRNVVISAGAETLPFIDAALAQARAALAPARGFVGQKGAP